MTPLLGMVLPINSIVNDCYLLQRQTQNIPQIIPGMLGDSDHPIRPAGTLDKQPTENPIETGLPGPGREVRELDWNQVVDS